ncbi:MAG: hypothetical protein WCK65_13700, partial [Rhodospirillaceae bacterium]
CARRSTQQLGPEWPGFSRKNQVKRRPRPEAKARQEAHQGRHNRATLSPMPTDNHPDPLGKNCGGFLSRTADG